MSKRLIAALLAAVCVSSNAGGIYVSKDVTVRLRDTPCEGIPAQLLGAEEAKAFRSGEVLFGGRAIYACWTLKEDKVLIIDSDGDAGHLPASVFKTDGL